MEKLTLSRETIRRLDDVMLGNVIGGRTIPGGNDDKTSLIQYETSVGCCKRPAEHPTV